MIPPADLLISTRLGRIRKRIIVIQGDRLLIDSRMLDRALIANVAFKRYLNTVAYKVKIQSFIADYIFYRFYFLTLSVLPV